MVPGDSPDIREDWTLAGGRHCYHGLHCQRRGRDGRCRFRIRRWGTRKGENYKISRPQSRKTRAVMAHCWLGRYRYSITVLAKAHRQRFSLRVFFCQAVTSPHVLSKVLQKTKSHDFHLEIERPKKGASVSAFLVLFCRKKPSGSFLRALDS